MKFVSYWENAPARTMPAYVALCLAWSKHVLGSDFLLLTARNTPALLGGDNLAQNWRFQPLPFTGDAAVLRVVAKSDFIRMAYVLRYGGVWLDADSIVFPSLARCLPGELQDRRLHWYSEAFFGATAGHPLLRQAVDACLAGGEQEWANPGGVRELLLGQPDLVRRIPYDDVDPGYRPEYRFELAN